MIHRADDSVKNTLSFGWYPFGRFEDPRNGIPAIQQWKRLLNLGKSVYRTEKHNMQNRIRTMFIN